MKEVATELLRRYRGWAVVVVLIVIALLWVTAHVVANPGGMVSVLWGLVEYQKADPTKGAEAPQPGPTAQLSPTPSPSELTVLRKLDDEQLRLFLILGGPTGDEVTFADKTLLYGFTRNYQVLAELGLIEYGGQNDKGQHRFGTTELGRHLHRAALEELQGAIENAE